ncbi:MAG: thymidine kinase, partial [Bdellovibrionales bacterium]|nr:thymidine kinase [Bdellovibrionales bacterium]
MYSGKTEELIRRIRRAQYARLPVVVFKPTIDDRYSQDSVGSHSGQRLRSFQVHKSEEIPPLVGDAAVVGIDEAQFFDANLPEVVERLANRGIRVVVAGLDMDYRGKPFGPMPELMAMAEDVKKLPAICVVCGAPATRSQRVSASEEQVLVGAHDSYEARCRAHHRPEAENPLLAKQPWRAAETQASH